ncbi:c-type cytochrome [Novosphingobium clariflavum]|uniref:C-type cytochrome n=1 Tax=Novosphingobium clariflavum TaxID=2029884 RepID=A0ABV6S6I7_9SPHN|nr:cytochrome c [Novosphingobium clariflavum]
MKLQPSVSRGALLAALALLSVSILAASEGAHGAAAEAGSAVPTTAAAGDDAEAIIFERQQIMQQLAKDSETLGGIVAGSQPRDQLAKVTRALADGAKDSLGSFRDKVPGGRSKPEVWSNNADFMKRMEDFARNSEAMAKAGESGNMAGVTALMIDALPCKQCHDLYREPKKPT